MQNAGFFMTRLLSSNTHLIYYSDHTAGLVMYAKNSVIAHKYEKRFYLNLSASQVRAFSTSNSVSDLALSASLISSIYKKNTAAAEAVGCSFVGGALFIAP